MLFKKTTIVLVCLFALTACAQGGKPVPTLALTRPSEPPAITPVLTRAAAGTLPVSTRAAQVTPRPGQLIPTLPANPRLPAGTVALPKVSLTLTALPFTPIPLTVQSVTRVSDYDAKQAIATYAVEVLGITVNVVRAGGARGAVTLPPSVERDVEAGASIAGVTYVGLLENGGASVSLGQGAVSGDLALDVQSASLGAFSLLSQNAMPADQAAALALVKQTFPGIAALDYTPIQAEQGFAFVATSSHQGVDWQTRQATLVGQAVQAGIIPTGRAQIAIYAVVGNGAFATALK
jgi:hypothetical protein